MKIWRVVFLFVIKKKKGENLMTLSLGEHCCHSSQLGWFRTYPIIRGMPNELSSDQMTAYCSCKEGRLPKEDYYVIKVIVVSLPKKIWQTCGDLRKFCRQQNWKRNKWTKVLNWIKKTVWKKADTLITTIFSLYNNTLNSHILKYYSNIEFLQ